MISEIEARAKLLQSVKPAAARHMSILQALDRFAAQDYFARLPLPMFDNSAMDGYAVIAADAKKDARLRVIGEQPAGIDRQLRISTGETARIFTGAPIPAGADAVVMQEDVARNDAEIVLNVDVDPGEFIRKRGYDLSEGQKILSKGEELTAAKLALLTSQGFAEVSVGGEVRVAIISTGDELARLGDELRAGQIYDSNSILLQGMVQRCGAIAALVEHSRDDANELRKKFQLAARNEILIVTGGVSVGEHDLVQGALRDLGAKIDIWRVAIKPGKPFLFGTLGDCFVFGLPGNPVSAFVTFLQFVRPAILKMMGAAEVALRRVPALLVVDLENESERPHYVRGKLENGNFTPVGRQESHALFGLSQSNALLRIESGKSLKAGAAVEIEIF
ncbi:MAG TPA: gephyrin-like molybdotransferase Glp [Chthoniobacterales bacterium]|jgi:molybdopterin molybdotransferase|nr:gephyrin-like molybdotransferase Glp [Chthoniobacterales bacterium]